MLIRSQSASSLVHRQCHQVELPASSEMFQCHSQPAQFYCLSMLTVTWKLEPQLLAVMVTVLVVVTPTLTMLQILNKNNHHFMSTLINISMTRFSALLSMTKLSLQNI